MFIISQAILASLFPVITKISLMRLTPIASLAWSMLFALIFFVFLGGIKGSLSKILDKEILPSLVGAGLIFGIVFPLLQFLGIKYTSAGNVGVILTLEVLFSFLFFNIWKKEFISTKHIAGCILMLLSAIIILIPNFSEFHKGDFIILFAVMLPPIGNLFQKRARAKIGSEGILFFRALMGVPALFLMAYLFGQYKTPPSGIWIIIALNGLVYFGLSKIFWVEGIHRISVTKSSALNSVGPVFTLLFAFLILKNVPSLAQIFAIPPAILGVYLLTRPAS